ncbi:MAG: gamma-glutamyl-gamma-aminobutyrate hydrolase family protein, partial [Planctomycetota bacterium]
MRPRIGLNCDIQTGAKPRVFLYLGYLDYVSVGGGVPLLLPPSPDAELLLDDLDGVLFTGGDDYRAGHSGADPPGFVPVAERREESDLRLARLALDRDLPVLGICG